MSQLQRVTKGSIETRPDCEAFEAKEWSDDCGDCQTDGHYLCSGCKNIAPFEEMEYYDNRKRYYSQQVNSLRWVPYKD